MLLSEYHEELEVDLLPRGVDLLDLYRSDWDGTALLTLRRLGVFARQLLKDRQSAVARAVSPVETAWGPTEYILADLVDIGLITNFKNPKPYPRPADREQERVLAEQRRAALEAQAARIRTQREAEGAT